MIAKVPEKRADGDSSFLDLVEYMTNRDEDQENYEYELNTSERRRHLDILKNVGINLASADDHLRAAGRVDHLDGATLRVRLGSARRAARADGAEHEQSVRGSDGSTEGELNVTQLKRSLARIYANLRSAGRYLGQTPEADRDFQERARARRASIASATPSAQRRHRRDAGNVDPAQGLDSLELTLGPQQLVTPSGVACEHNCLSLITASAEMEAVAAQNPRVGDPVYHVVVSWAPGENPTDTQAFECARYALKAVGMEDHQYVFAVHRDTDNAHVHIAVNRVNPETFKAVYPERDYYKLDRAMRELEIAHGWQEVEGVFSIFERNGKKVVDWTSSSPDTKGKRPSKASDMERFDGVESFFTYVRNEPRKAIAALLKRETLTWQAIHHQLAKHNIELREKGQGFAIYDLASDTTTPVKASDLHEGLSKARLVKRLGAFELPRSIDVVPSAIYDKHRPLKRDPKQREERRLERATGRRALREQYQKYKKSFVYRRLDPAAVKARFAAIADEARDRRAQVKNSKGSAAVKKAMYSVIAFETLRERERLKVQLQREREELRADPANRSLTFRQWVENEAAAGVPAAISQVRGWAYSEKRMANTLERSAGDDLKDGIRYDTVADPVAISTAEGLTFKVRRSGSVHYETQQGVELFVDLGRVIHMSDVSARNHQAVLAALRHATEKFGSTFELTGSPEFKHSTVALMTRYKMNVTLKNPDLEQLRKAMEAEIKASERKGGSRGTRPA
ncbi:TraI/MobA(P) family conjugative relaxase [Pseudomonas siliginis]|uniref:TraI/MobA(P) family conjugative relaxase n=1 Tax=Pseudomonas siliginis TaxID=2842346 RepID=UPI002092F32E|nr:TraI/MobA(P) family conjugative relaxase [Pseudomonas siliginis]UST77209.1 relaxase/mobilization nuclease domain-containing protein [Pseudomonas siliginis]